MNTTRQISTEIPGYGIAGPYDSDIFEKIVARPKPELVAEVVFRSGCFTATRARRLGKAALAAILADFDTATRYLAEQRREMERLAAEARRADHDRAVAEAEAAFDAEMIVHAERLEAERRGEPVADPKPVALDQVPDDCWHDSGSIKFTDGVWHCIDCPPVPVKLTSWSTGALEVEAIAQAVKTLRHYGLATPSDFDVAVKVREIADGTHAPVMVVEAYGRALVR